MTDAEQLAMFKLALRDIRDIREACPGGWEEMLSDCRTIARSAMALNYKGYQELFAKDQEDDE